MTTKIGFLPHFLGCTSLSLLIRTCCFHDIIAHGISLRLTTSAKHPWHLHKAHGRCCRCHSINHSVSFVYVRFHVRSVVVCDSMTKRDYMIQPLAQDHVCLNDQVRFCGLKSLGFRAFWREHSCKEGPRRKASCLVRGPSAKPST